MTDSDQYDTTEKVERTDRGFRLTVESTRGTGTRDQDKVKAELRTEEYPEYEEYDTVVSDVKKTMSTLRDHQPDGGGDE